VYEKYDAETYELIMESFDTMPLIAIIANQYLGVHGGISPLIDTLKDVNKLNRFGEIPYEGLICDLVWADPIDDKKADQYDFLENPERQCSYKFGLNPTRKILNENDLTLIVRGHQV
jgi:serine/threonine-protein phosphatase 2B catalytic subunit